MQGRRGREKGEEKKCKVKGVRFRNAREKGGGTRVSL